MAKHHLAPWNPGVIYRIVKETELSWNGMMEQIEEFHRQEDEAQDEFARYADKLND